MCGSNGLRNHLVQAPYILFHWIFISELSSVNEKISSETKSDLLSKADE